LHTENQLYTLPGSALKVKWWWVLKVNLVIALAELSFGQAEQNHSIPQIMSMRDTWSYIS
jgi:hypothetical protein